MGIVVIIFSNLNELARSAYRFHEFGAIHSKHLQDDVMTNRHCSAARREKSQKESGICKNSVPCSPPTCTLQTSHACRMGWGCVCVCVCVGL